MPNNCIQIVRALVAAGEVLTPDQVLAIYHFDSLPGSNGKDDKGNIVSASASSNIVPGVFNNAFKHSSSTNSPGYVSVRIQEALDTNDFTLEGFAKSDGVFSQNAAMGLFSVGGLNYDKYTFGIRLSPTGVLQITNGSTNNVIGQEDDGKGIGAAFGWTHLALTRESNVFKLWRNGKLVATATSTNPITALYVCAGRANGSGCTDSLGYSDELRLTKGVRYTKDFTPPQQPFSL